MPNAARGEVVARLGGRETRLCLTLGAMAAMETGLGCSGVAALVERLRQASATDLAVVLRALAPDLTAEAVASLSPREAAEAVTACFAAAA